MYSANNTEISTPVDCKIYFFVLKKKIFFFSYSSFLTINFFFIAVTIIREPLDDIPPGTLLPIYCVIA